MTALAHAAPPSASPPVVPTVIPAVASPLAGGPGWFQSSWDLLMGLEVQELSLAELGQAAGGGAEPAPPSAT